MTREQVLDEAVRRSMKPITMKQVVRHADKTNEIRSHCVPHRWTEDDWGPVNGAAPEWWDGTIAEHVLDRLPGCVNSIRVKCRQSLTP